MSTPASEAASENIIRRALADMPEPTADGPDQSEAFLSLDEDIKARLAFLMDMRTRNLPGDFPQLPDTSILSSYLGRRLILKWRMFPINDLPEEILLKIFHYVAWSTDNVHISAVARLRITWVCKRWRYVAINDVFLWNAIWFRDPPPYNRSLAFVERAGSAPIDIRICESNEQWQQDHRDDGNTSEDDHPYTADMAGALMDRLLTKIHVIRLLSIAVDTWPAALMFLAKIRDAKVIPARLQRFELHRTGRPWLRIGPQFANPEGHWEPIPLGDGRILPKLDYLCLNSIHVDWSITRVANLAVLDLRMLAMENSPTLDQFRDILRASPNLSRLALRAAGPRWPQDDVHVPLPPIDLLNLTCLILGEISVEYFLYCLQTFRAPNIIELVIHNLVGGDYGLLVESMTSRFPEVQVLTISTVEIDDSVSNKRRLIAWLKSMPNLRFFKCAQIKRHILRAFLEDPRQWDGSIVDILSPRKEMVPLCPNLVGMEFQSLPIELVLYFLVGRKKLKVPLQNVYVLSEWYDTMTDEEKKVLCSIVTLYKFFRGYPTAEEINIRKAWCQSRGIPLGYLH